VVRQEEDSAAYLDNVLMQQTLLILPIAATIIVGIWVWRLVLMRRLHHEAVRRSEDRSGPLQVIPLAAAIGTVLIKLDATGLVKSQTANFRFGVIY